MGKILFLILCFFFYGTFNFKHNVEINENVKDEIESIGSVNIEKVNINNLELYPGAYMVYAVKVNTKDLDCSKISLDIVGTIKASNFSGEMEWQVYKTDELIENPIIDCAYSSEAKDYENCELNASFKEDNLVKKVVVDDFTNEKIKVSEVIQKNQEYYWYFIGTFKSKKVPDSLNVTIKGENIKVRS